MMNIKLLPDNIVNQIAAGEVVERPASVVKELVENSIDAGATNIEVAIKNGGTSYISVSDNGSGMNEDDLVMSITRHATSKMDAKDLFDINTFGFRGEALASITSIAKVSIKSRVEDSFDAWELKISGGKDIAVLPAALNKGTKVEIRDLFFATPARLKFLKADATEVRYVKEIVAKIAMANPDVSISLINNDKKVYSFEKNDLKSRVYSIMDKEFSSKSIEVDVLVNDISLSGYIGVPSYNKSNSLYQYVFVNGRPVKDKLIMGAIRAGYMDVIEHGRYPSVVLFIDLPPKEVDVNVHPAKSEVRFKDTKIIRSVIVHAIREAIENNKSETQSIFAIEKKFDLSNSQVGDSSIVKQNITRVPNHSFSAPQKSYDSFKESSQESFVIQAPMVKAEDVDSTVVAKQEEYPLGSAKAQLHKNYIVSQAEDSVFIVDQHAAHERIVYENIKNKLENGGVDTQNLLIPDVVDLNKTQIDVLLAKKDELYTLGMEVEGFGEGAVIIRSLPALLKNKVDVKRMVSDLADELLDLGDSDILKAKLYEVCATIACHGSVRSGRVLNIAEMNELLRQMEDCKNIQQCNHGRPTYVKLSLKDIEKLFNR